MENKLTNKTKTMSIFWWTIKRYIPVSIAYWILLAFSLPVIEVFLSIVVTAEMDFEEYVDGMKEIATYLAGTGFAAVAILFSTIVAMIAFSYMHNKRSVDFFGSLPVSRRTMFFARFVATIVLTVVPVIIFGTTGACLAGSFAAAGSILKVVCYIILATIGNIAIIAFVSLCCGSTVDIIISYAAINIAFPLCITVFNFFPSTVIPGMGAEVWPASVYTLFCPVASVFTMSFGDGKVFGVIWWILITAIAVAGSYILSKKRKAELAQNTYTFSAVEIVVKFIVCSLAGLGLGWMMAYVGSVHKTIAIQYLYFLFGLVSGIMVANILLHLVFHRGLVKFQKSLLECGIVFAVCGVYTVVIASGLFGYDIRMPERSEIKSVSLINGYEEEFWVEGENILLKGETDESKIDDIYDIHKEIIEINKKNQKWWLYPLTGVSTFSLDEYYDTTNPEATIIYKLADGTQFYRSYSYGEVGVNIKSNLYTEINNENLINTIPEDYVNYISLNIWEDNTDVYIDVLKDQKKIVNAIKKDLEIYGEISENDTIGSIFIEYNDKKGNWKGISVRFNRNYFNTMTALKEAGYDNFKYCHFNDVYTLNGISKKTEQTIYFKLPKGMDPNKEVRCMQGYRYDSEYFFNLSDDKTLCEHVEGDIWKYTLYEIETLDQEYYGDLRQGIIICQVEEDTVIDTGMILLDNDATNNMLTIGARKRNKKGALTYNNYYKPIYEYEWTKYKK